MFDFKRLPFLSVVFFLILGCATGMVKKTDGPSVAEAQAVSALGPKARIVVAQFLNNTGGLESQLQRMALQMQASMPDTDAMMAYQEKMMNYQAELMRYQARLNELGSEKAGPPQGAEVSKSIYFSVYEIGIRSGGRWIARYDDQCSF